MAITISGENNNDRITATDGVIDQLSGLNVVGVITATSLTGNLTGNVTGNLTGDVTGNVTGNINNSTLLLQTGGYERIRITSGGQVAIGTNTTETNFLTTINGDLSLGEKNGVDNTYIDQKQDGDLHIINSGRTSNGGSGTQGTAGVGVNRFNTLAGGTTFHRDFTVYNGKNSKVLVVDGSANAVGIGTDSPTKKLQINTTGSSGEGIILKATDNTYPSFIGDANRSAYDLFLVALQGYWNGNRVGEVTVESGSDTTNKDEGMVKIRTRNAGDSSPQDRLTVYHTGQTQIHSTTDSSSTTTGSLIVSGGVGIAKQVKVGNGILIGSGNQTKTQDGVMIERNSVDGTAHIIAGRSGGNYSGMNFYVAGASGVTLRHQVDYQSNFKWFDADGTTERLRITSDGKVCIAHDSVLHSGNLQVSTAGADAIDINSYSTNENSGGRLTFYRSKNASIGSNTIVVNDDSLGRIDFRGYNSNGNSYDQGATIEARVEGTVNSTTDMPTAILFKTSGDGSASPDERLRILSNGNISVGSNGAAAEKFQVNSGSIAIVGMPSGGGYKIDTHPLVSYASFTDISGGSYAARLGSTGSSTVRSTQIYGGGGHIATFDGVNKRLGIKQTAPDTSLHVKNGTLMIHTDTNFYNGSGENGENHPTIFFKGDHSSGNNPAHGKITVRHSSQNTYSGDILLMPQGYYDGSYGYEEVLRVSAHKRVGINDSSPDAVLSIKGDTNGDSLPSIRMKDGTDTREAWISNVSGDLYLVNGGDDNAYHSRIRLMDGKSIYFDIDGVSGSALIIDSNANLKQGEATNNAFTSSSPNARQRFLGPKCMQGTVTDTTTLDNSGNGTFDLGKLWITDDSSIEMFIQVVRNDTGNYTTHYAKAFINKVRGTGMSQGHILYQNGAASGFSLSDPTSGGYASPTPSHGTQISCSGGAGGVIYRLTCFYTTISKNDMY